MLICSEWDAVCISLGLGARGTPRSDQRFRRPLGHVWLQRGGLRLILWAQNGYFWKAYIFLGNDWFVDPRKATLHAEHAAGGMSCHRTMAGHVHVLNRRRGCVRHAVTRRRIRRGTCCASLNARDQQRANRYNPHHDVDPAAHEPDGTPVMIDALALGKWLCCSLDASQSRTQTTGPK